MCVRHCITKAGSVTGTTINVHKPDHYPHNMVTVERENFRDVAEALELLQRRKLQDEGAAAEAEDLNDDVEHLQVVRARGAAPAAAASATSSLPSSPPTAPKFQLCPKALYRCGRIDFASWEELGKPKTILNLRMEEDDTASPHLVERNVRFVHKPAPNIQENYHVDEKEVKRWLADTLKVFEDPASFPVLVHCRAGRDRTGLVVACLLLMCDIPVDLVWREYHLTKEPKSQLFAESLQRFGVAHLMVSGVAAADDDDGAKKAIVDDLKDSECGNNKGPGKGAGNNKGNKGNKGTKGNKGSKGGKYANESSKAEKTKKANHKGHGKGKKATAAAAHDDDDDDDGDDSNQDLRQEAMLTSAILDEFFRRQVDIAAIRKNLMRM